MPIHFKELEEKLERWLSFLMITKPTDSPASWVTYKAMQSAVKSKFLKELKEMFEDILQDDVKRIRTEDGKKHFLIKQSKL